MAETIESALSLNVSICKVYPIYKVIKEGISSVYNVNGCRTSISALGLSVTFLHGDLIEYKQQDRRISITPYRHYLHKRFCAENDAEVVFENQQYKIVNVELEEVGNILERAKEAFDKIESLDF